MRRFYTAIRQCGNLLRVSFGRAGNKNLARYCASLTQAKRIKASFVRNWRLPQLLCRAGQDDIVAPPRTSRNDKGKGSRKKVRRIKGTKSPRVPALLVSGIEAPQKAPSLFLIGLLAMSEATTLPAPIEMSMSSSP
jgi:hypothetical protein